VVIVLQFTQLREFEAKYDPEMQVKHLLDVWLQVKQFEIFEHKRQLVELAK
jgi:hypothetical protein